MSNQNTAEQDSVELEPRTRRALERVASVLHTDGTPIADLGVSRSLVTQVVNDEDVKAVTPNELSTEEKRAEVREYVDANPTAPDREVAREVECDVSHPTVGKWRDEWDVKEPTTKLDTVTNSNTAAEPARELAETATDPSMVAVESGNSGREHMIDLREERCTCADHRHRGAECYHLRRAKIALGIRPVATAELAAADVDPQLAEHAPGPKVIASDGGVVGGDGAELIDDDAPATWKGPFPEYNRYGEPTGARYVRCSECGVEVLEGETEHATHRAGCDGVDATSD